MVTSMQVFYYGKGPKICYACNLKGVCDFYPSPKNGPDRSMLIEGLC